MSCFPPPPPHPPYGSWTLPDLKACEIDPKNWDDTASDRAVDGEWIGKKESRKQTWDATRELKSGALAAKTVLLSPLPSSSAPCAVLVGTATRALDYAATQVFQLHVLGPGRTDRAVASPQTSFRVRSSRIQTPKDVYGESNGAEDWEGTFSFRGGMAVFADC